MAYRGSPRQELLGPTFVGNQERPGKMDNSWIKAACILHDSLTCNEECAGRNHKHGVLGAAALDKCLTNVDGSTQFLNEVQIMRYEFRLTSYAARPPAFLSPRGRILDANPQDRSTSYSAPLAVSHFGSKMAIRGQSANPSRGLGVPGRE